MFFLLSKLLLFIVSPLVWIIGLLLYYAFSKNELRKRKAFRAALIILIFFSNSFILDEFMRMWEIPATPNSEIKGKEYAAGIVLGGFSSYDPTLERIQFNQGTDRLMQAIDLYHKGIIKKIIVTGGSGSILHAEEKEAIPVKEFLRGTGISTGDIIIESESRNTRENAVNTKKLLEKDSIQGNFLLITSAFHMRRAKGCFKRAGIEADRYSTDRYSGPRKFEFDHLLIPSVEALQAWSALIHEVVGAMVYKIVGYS